MEEYYDSIVPGGFVVIDDYGFWEGCTKAVDEFIERRGLSVELRRIPYAGLEGLEYEGAYFRKE